MICSDRVKLMMLERKLIDAIYENQKFREENITLKELLEKAYEFMKQFVIAVINLLERFLESVWKVVVRTKISEIDSKKIIF